MGVETHRDPFNRPFFEDCNNTDQHIGKCRKTDEEAPQSVQSPAHNEASGLSAIEK